MKGVNIDMKNTMHLVTLKWNNIYTEQCEG